jgi:hypothetical protein
MRLHTFAAHLFSATLLLVGVALVMGACSSNSSRTASDRADDAQERASMAAPVRGAVRTAEHQAPENGDDHVRPANHAAALEADEKDAKKQYKPLFVDWEKPQATLFITGRQDGYIEPCGCTGLTNQKGGLNRKYTFLQQLKAKGWNPVGVDVGNQIRRFGRQAEIKFQTTIDGLRKMNYKAIALGPDDLRLTFDELLSVVAPVDGSEEAKIFVCANVDLFEMNARYRIVEAGGKKIGITAILGEKLQQRVTSDEIAMTSPDEALREVWPKLEAAQCDLHVLLAHTSLEDSRRLAEAFPGFQIVVTAGGFGEPTDHPDPLNDGRTWLVQVGTKGMYVGVIGIFDDPKQPLRYQKASLDARFPDAEPMLDLLDQYQHQLETLGLTGLGLKPRVHPSGRQFVGSEQCGECHTTAYEIWEETPHAHATETLVKPPERYQVPRHHDPECLSCHVVGWDPQGYSPYESGYLSLKSDEAIHHVGCENCHGPGSQHVAAENGDIDATDEQLKAYQQAMVLKLKDAEDFCKKCHDLDNSPDFHEEGAFEKYWEQVEHVGKD